MTTNPLLQAIDVWRRLDTGALVRYRCFLVLPNRGYFVQSADFYYPDKPNDDKKDKFLQNEFIDHLASRAELPDLYDNLEDAISKHDSDFKDFPLPDGTKLPL